MIHYTVCETDGNFLSTFPDMRILLVFLMDPGARPSPKDMKLWVDVIRFVKSGARGGALSFFTYMELSTFVRIFTGLRADLERDDSNLASVVPHFPTRPTQVVCLPFAWHMRKRALNRVCHCRLFFIMQGWGVYPDEYKRHPLGASKL